jgi:putative SOS response-associated peptidase YedK
LATERETLARAFGVSGVPELPPRYNIAPTQSVPAVRLAGGERRMELLRWGLIPFWAKDPEIGYRMINARAETVAEKPAYREAFRRRRCLMVADGFYEWKKLNGGKQPYYFRLRSGEPFAFAGLWERWEGPDGPVESCALITTGPNAVVGEVHDRMPVILEPEDYGVWLEAEDPDLLRSLLRPYSGDGLVAYPVGRRVNNPRNDEPSVIEPLEA